MRKTKIGDIIREKVGNYRWTVISKEEAIKNCKTSDLDYIKSLKNFLCCISPDGNKDYNLVDENLKVYKTGEYIFETNIFVKKNLNKINFKFLNDK